MINREENVLQGQIVVLSSGQASGHLTQIILGNVRVLAIVGIQFTRNYRFGCEFVLKLKYFSSPIDRFFVFLTVFCEIYENRALHAGSITFTSNWTSSSFTLNFLEQRLV